MIAPGATIGIIGGGQLGRMSALAAARMGYRVHIFSPEPDSPASQVAAATTLAAYEDGAALDAFARSIDVATFEFENIPAETVERLAAVVPVHPGAEVLRITQDRLREKDFLRSIQIETTNYREVSGPASLQRAMRDLGQGAVLKTVRMGYDGKGQLRVGPDTDPEEAWRRLGTDVAILEQFVDFKLELSVIVARNGLGGWATYAPMENQHSNHILDTTIVPARLSPDTAMRAEAMARHVAEKLGLIGVLAVEMFLTQDGTLLVNELAPRPHNSGHWTIDASVTSQFEQLVRAICGLPLGSTECHADAVMKKPDRRRCGPLARGAQRSGCQAAPLWQGRSASGPQDGARNAADLAALTDRGRPGQAS